MPENIEKRLDQLLAEAEELDWGEMLIRDRIKDFRRVRASILRPNPKNWRLHSETQRSALQGVLAEIGYVDALLARELPDGTLILVDGHLRAETTPDTEVPVLILDVSESEADYIIATFDPLTSLAETDREKLDSLIDEIEVANPAVELMLQELRSAAGDTDAMTSDDASKSLTERFGAPPFSVLDSRQGYWQDRKKSWFGIGIQSDLGRKGGNHE